MNGGIWIRLSTFCSTAALRETEPGPESSLCSVLRPDTVWEVRFVYTLGNQSVNNKRTPTYVNRFIHIWTHKQSDDQKKQRTVISVKLNQKCCIKSVLHVGKVSSSWFLFMSRPVSLTYNQESVLERDPWRAAVVYQGENRDIGLSLIACLKITFKKTVASVFYSLLCRLVFFTCPGINKCQGAVGERCKDLGCQWVTGLPG